MHDAHETGKRYVYSALILYLCLIIFTPYMSVAGRDNFEITFVVTLFFAALLHSALKRYRQGENMILSNLLNIMFAVLIMESISILNYIRVTGETENIVANAVPNVKVALYILIIAGLYSVDFDASKLRRFIYVAIPSIGAVLALIGIFQRFNVFNFNSWFTSHYISTESGKVLIEVLGQNQQWSRVLGTLSNPNFYSLELIIFLMFTVSNIIFEYGIARAINIVISLLLFTTIIFTQSRTAIAVVFGICIYVLIIQAIKGGRRYAFMYAGLAVGIIAVSVLLIRFMNLNYLLEFVKDGLKTRSITQRVQRWNDALNLFKLHPIVGIGPVIGQYFSAVDNEYIQLLRNYGILGLSTYLSFYIYVFIRTIKSYFKNDSAIARQYGFAVNCSVLAIMVTNITSATFLHWRNFAVFLIMCCMWAKAEQVGHTDF